MNDVVEQMEATFAQNKIVDLLNGESSSIPLGIKLPIRRQPVGKREQVGFAAESVHANTQKNNDNF